jgi:hypothetical protein
LWHSVVFHAAFELFLTPAKFTPRPEEKILRALQRTWAVYKEEVEEDQLDEFDSLEIPRLVPPEDLANGFGAGYGDMSEALATIQNELSESSNQAAVKISELITLIPLATLDGSWPTPEKAWSMAEEWKITDTPLIAVDISLPALTQDSNSRLASWWIPWQDGSMPRSCSTSTSASTNSSDSSTPSRSDLGPGHRLVALVCYMSTISHYVAFCRRQQDSSRCLFFNDLPGLTRGAPSEMDWHEVPPLCYKHNLQTRLALFESLGAAEEVVLNLKKPVADCADVENAAGERSAADGRSADACRQQ